MANKTETAASLINGVDRDKLFGTIDQIKGRPELAKFKFEIRNDWQGAAHNRSTIQTFFGAGTNLEHAVKFEVDADEPAILLGQDQGPSAGEYLLHALAACVTTTMFRLVFEFRGTAFRRFDDYINVFRFRTERADA